MEAVHRVGMEKRLGAKVGVFVHGEVVENKSGPGQQAHPHRDRRTGLPSEADIRLVIRRLVAADS